MSCHRPLGSAKLTVGFLGGGGGQEAFFAAADMMGKRGIFTRLFSCLSVPRVRTFRAAFRSACAVRIWSAYKSNGLRHQQGHSRRRQRPQQGSGFIQELDARDSPQLQERLLSLLDLLLVAAASKPVELPVLEHKSRLPSGKRGLSLDALRAIRTFYDQRGALGKVMGDVCKEPGFEASACALTLSTGLSLAESLVRVANKDGVDVTKLVGSATTFFSYSWTGTKLGDMLAAIERKVEELERADGVRRFVWVDMFAASQNLLAGRYLPATEAARAELKQNDLAAYRARKEDTDTIFDDAIDAVGTSVPKEILLYLSPLTGEWRAPDQPYLLPDRGSPPANWMRKGPGAITRAWCCFEMVKTLAKGCNLHVVLSPADVDGFEELLTWRFDEIAKIVAEIEVRDAQISKVEDREYILGEVAKLEGGLGGRDGDGVRVAALVAGGGGEGGVGEDGGCEGEGDVGAAESGCEVTSGSGQAGGGGAAVQGGARGEACDAGRPPP